MLAISMMRVLALVLRLLGNIFRYLGALFEQLYDLPLFVPLWLEERVARLSGSDDRTIPKEVRS
jgi:hypothetical protein